MAKSWPFASAQRMLAMPDLAKRCAHCTQPHFLQLTPFIWVQLSQASALSKKASWMRYSPIPAPIWAWPGAASLVGAADVLYICVRVMRPHQVQPLLGEGCLRDRAEDISAPDSSDMLTCSPTPASSSPLPAMAAACV